MPDQVTPRRSLPRQVPPFWLLQWGLDCPTSWAGNHDCALLPLAFLHPFSSPPNWRASDYWLKFPSDLHERRGSVFRRPPARSAPTAASLGMRGRGGARRSRARAVSWRPATWHPRLDMGRLSRPGSSSTSQRNLPVRGSARGWGAEAPRQVAVLWAVATPGGFSNLFPESKLRGKVGGREREVWDSVSSF